jgi:hypothetical protein
MAAPPPRQSAVNRGVDEPNLWSLGFDLGEPSGLTVKKWLGGSDALDLNVGFFAPGVRFSADYLFGLAQLMRDRSTLNLDVYVGAGPMLGVLYGACGWSGFSRYCGNGEVYVGARVPLGIEAVFKTAPVAIGFEVAPGLAFASSGPAGLVDFLLTLRLLLR